MPAKCQRCGNVFPSGFNLSGVTNAKLVENSQQCPRCGGMGIVVGGTFDVGTDGSVRQKEGPASNTAIFTALGIALIEAKMDRASPNQIVEKVAAIDPGIAARLRAVADDRQALAMLLSALIAAITAIAVAAITSSAEPNETVIKVYTERQDDSDLLRYRNDVQKMRHERRPMPEWSANYI